MFRKFCKERRPFPADIIHIFFPAYLCILFTNVFEIIQICNLEEGERGKVFTKSDQHGNASGGNWGIA